MGSRYRFFSNFLVLAARFGCSGSAREQVQLSICMLCEDPSSSRKQTRRSGRSFKERGGNVVKQYEFLRPSRSILIPYVTTHFLSSFFIPLCSQGTNSHFLSHVLSF